MAPRALARPRRDSRRAAPGDGTLAARAAALELDDDARAMLAGAFGAPAGPPTEDRAADDAADVVVVMGIPGAGKSRDRRGVRRAGYVRLNRDERGGSLRALAETLDEELASGARRLVLDNTYLTRASRSYVVEAAARHRATARCIWLDTPLADAQVNVVERLLERFGTLPTPEEVREAAKREPGVHAPTSQMRALRELEPPTGDEGFASVERVPFVRGPSEAAGAGVFVAAPVLQVARLGEGGRAGRPGCAAPPLRLEPRRRAGRARSADRGARAPGLGARRERGLPASRGAAELLVQTAAPGSRARLRLRARSRPRSVVADRQCARPPHARDDARRPLRHGLSRRA